MKRSEFVKAEEERMSPHVINQMLIEDRVQAAERAGVTWDPEEEVLWATKQTERWMPIRLLASGEWQYAADGITWGPDPEPSPSMVELARRILAEREGQGAKDEPSAESFAAARRYGCRRGGGLEGSDGEAVESLRDLADEQHRDRMDRDLRQLGAAIHNLGVTVNGLQTKAESGRERLDFLEKMDSLRVEQFQATTQRLIALEQGEKLRKERMIAAEQHLSDLQVAMNHVLDELTRVSSRLAEIAPNIR